MELNLTITVRIGIKIFLPIYKMNCKPRINNTVSHQTLIFVKHKSSEIDLTVLSNLKFRYSKKKSPVIEVDYFSLQLNILL